MATIVIPPSIPNLNPLFPRSYPALGPITLFKATKIVTSRLRVNATSESNSKLCVRAISKSNSSRIWDSDIVMNKPKNNTCIWGSDIVVDKPKNNVLIRSKWNLDDVKTLVGITAVHLLAMFAPFHFKWGAFWVAFGLYWITGIVGITLSYHRNLTHKSFKLPKWLEYLFAYFGVLAIQDDPITWVSNHRFHHKFCDTKQDPHSPLEGFWFSHINWLFDHTTLRKKVGAVNNVGDLEEQPFYRFLRSTYLLHPVALGVLLYVFGGFSYLAWGVGVRTTVAYHITFFVNSVCHIWGNQAWNTGDWSRNNWWVALLSGGEGWHNNHHAFEYSARHGLEWWQIDVTWYIIKFLEVIGLAKDVKLPIEAHKQRLSFKPSLRTNHQ